MTDATDNNIAAALDKLAAELRQRPAQRSWIDAFRDGLVLTAADAAKIAGVDAQTIRRWCEQAANTANPLGYFVTGGSLWLVDANALLDEIEARRDLHARVVAKARLDEHREALARVPQSIALPARAMG